MPPSQFLLTSLARYRCAFARARSLRFWRTSLAAAALAAALPTTANAQFPAVFELGSLDGTNGFSIIGGDGVGGVGRTVSDAGDINGDGIGDLILGAWSADPNSVQDAGTSYVIFGRDDSPFSASIRLDSLDGTDGFAINGIDAIDRSGISVSGGGDVNGDGIDDLIVGAHTADPGSRTDAGETYVVFGSREPFGPSLELRELDGGNGFAINGIEDTDRSGLRVSDAGDVNGDGIDDILIGASLASPSSILSYHAGESYVVFGSDSPFPPAFELSSLNGANGFTINGIDRLDWSGRSVSGAGDVNGDGIDDLVIGAPQADPGSPMRPFEFNAGESYVVFGKDTPFAPTLELSDLTGADGFVLNGTTGQGESGKSVSEAGDVNGDGVGDLIVGAFMDNPPGRPRAGQSYVLFGKDAPFSATIELDQVSGADGFVLDGARAGDFSGQAVSGAGDVNGDGVDDLIIGAYNADPDGREAAGESYVVFGRSSPFAASFDLASLNGEDGFVIRGVDAGDFSGRSVGGAGDINGDGIDDLVVGANGVDRGDGVRIGAAYVIFGRRIPEPTTALLAASGLLAWNPRRRWGTVGSS